MCRKAQNWGQNQAVKTLNTRTSILSPVHTTMFGLSISVSGNVGFESQRTVMATVIGAVSPLSSYTTLLLQALPFV